jgi:hypothetical protein
MLLAHGRISARDAHLAVDRNSSTERSSSSTYIQDAKVPERLREDNLARGKRYAPQWRMNESPGNTGVVSSSWSGKRDLNWIE